MKKLDPWRLMNAARAHATESDPEHEVGDLQDIVIACFEQMKKKQKRAVFRQWNITDMLKEWGEDE